MKKFKKNYKSIIIAIIIALGLVVLDQLTKWLSVKYLSDGRIITVIKNVIDFRLAYNTGFAFGLGDDYRFIWPIVSLIGTLVLIFFMKDVNFKSNKIYTIAMILVLAGTIGNMIDRMFSTEGVVDFIEPTFIDFAVFNVADSYITVGAGFLIVYVLFFYEEPKKRVETKKEEIIEEPVVEEIIKEPVVEEIIKEDETK